MKKFISKILILLIINIIIYNLIIYLIYNKSFLSSICTAPRNEKYDFVLLGTSHTQLFYNYIVEPIISKKMKNLATGAAGVIPQKIQLECFFETNNKSKQVVYVLDPWALYSDRWNETNYILQQEGVEYSYFFKLLKNNVDKKVLFNYFRDKLADNYDKFMRDLLTPKIAPPAEKAKPKDDPKEALAIKETLLREERMVQKTLEEQDELNKAEDKQRLDTLYDQGLNEQLFSRYSRQLEKIILLAKKNNAETVFIIPPTLMGKMPGHDNTIKLLSELKKRYGMNYFDLSNIMQTQDYYFDREHFNKTGVEYFTQNYLKKIIN